MGVAFQCAKVAVSDNERDFNVIELRLFKEAAGGFVSEAMERKPLNLCVAHNAPEPVVEGVRVQLPEDERFFFVLGR